MMGLFTKCDAATEGSVTNSHAKLDPKGKSTKLIGPIASLQRVLKTYLSGGDELLQNRGLSNHVDPGSDHIPSVPVSSLNFNEDEELRDDRWSLDGTDDGLECCLDEQNIPDLDISAVVNALSIRYGIDSETESVVSDYSEMADPVKEHLANVQIINCAELDPNVPTHFIVQQKIFHRSQEDEAGYLRRLRKTNFLSLAQEFAELKRQNASVLPFNLHEDRYQELLRCDTEFDDAEDSLDTAGDVSICSSKTEGECDSGCHDGSAGQRDTISLSTFTESDSDDHATSDVKCVVDLKQGDITIDSIGRVTHSTFETVLIEDTSRTTLMDTSNLPDGDVVPIVISESLPVLPNVGFSCDQELSTLCSDDLCSQTGFDASSGTVIYDRKETSFLGNVNKEHDSTQFDWMTHPVNHVVRAAEAEQRLMLGGYCKRSEICQRLATAGDKNWYKAEFSEGESDPIDNNLEICYVNEEADDDLDLDPGEPDCSKSHVLTKEFDSVPGGHLAFGNDILAQQAHLEAEAKFAFAHVQHKAKEQPESDVHMSMSAVSQILGLYGSNKKCISLKVLEQMTLAQLQIVLNDMHEQIEVLNKRLMLHLMERDELHMVQDSMLVDIEDLSGQAREYASKVDSRSRDQK